MALNQNQFSITTLRGTLDSGSSITCQYYDADPAGLITAGEFVMLSGVAPQSVAPAVSVVKKGVDRASKYLGMVLTNPLRSFWISGDKLEVAIIGTIAMVEAKNAIPGGTSLGYDPAFPGQVIGAGPGETVVGVAMESATAAGQLIRALIRTEY
jgi:hypothetical protein